MKQLIRMNNRELSFRLKLNYNNVYSRLKMLLGRKASLFADISTRSACTTWYSSDDAEYMRLSEVSKGDEKNVLAALDVATKAVAKELKSSSELAPYADDILEIPDTSFVFYRKDGAEYKIVLAGWGCKYAHASAGESSIGIVRKIKGLNNNDVTGEQDFITDGKETEILDGKKEKDRGRSLLEKEGRGGADDVFVKPDEDYWEHEIQGNGQGASKEDESRGGNGQSTPPGGKHEHKRLQHVKLRVLDQKGNAVSGENVRIIAPGIDTVRQTDEDGLVDVGDLPSSSIFTISFPEISSIPERSFEVESKVEVYDAYIKKLVKYSPVLFVEDQSGHMVQNYDIKVIIGGQETVYNSGGEGMIQLPFMQEGQKFIVIDSLNYANTEDFDVTSEKAKTPYHFKIKRPEKVKIGITILDKKQKPIPEAAVEIELGNTPCLQLTGADGRAEFPSDIFYDGVIPVGIRVKGKSKIVHDLNYSSDVTEYAIQIKNKAMSFDWRWLGLIPLLALLGWGGAELYDKYVDKAPSVDKMKTGVALVLTRTIYSVDFGIDDITIDGHPCVAYFSYVANENRISNVTFNPDAKIPSIGTGTGFLISEDGLIATNKHVANPVIPQKLAEKLLREYLQSQKRNNQRRCDDINDSLNIIGLANLGKQKSVQLYKELAYRREQIQNWDKLLNVGSFEVKKSISLYVAFTGTNIDPKLESLDGFVGCNHLISGNSGDNVDENDVAIIQLRNKGKEIPDGAYIFDVPQKDVLGKDMPKDKAITVIGYNAGFGLQNLEKQDGIQPQIQSGELNNLAEKYRIGYNAPTLGGSSGSPVVNNDGILVAVHNSGIRASDSFNYGIRAKYLREILDEVQSKNEKK